MLRSYGSTSGLFAVKFAAPVDTIVQHASFIKPACRISTDTSTATRVVNSHYTRRFAEFLAAISNQNFRSSAHMSLTIVAQQEG